MIQLYKQTFLIYNILRLLSRSISSFECDSFQSIFVFIVDAVILPICAVYFISSGLSLVRIFFCSVLYAIFIYDFRNWITKFWFTFLVCNFQNDVEKVCNENCVGSSKHKTIYLCYCYSLSISLWLSLFLHPLHLVCIAICIGIELNASNRQAKERKKHTWNSYHSSTIKRGWRFFHPNPKELIVVLNHF